MNFNGVFNAQASVRKSVLQALAIAHLMDVLRSAQRLPMDAQGATRASVNLHVMRVFKSVEMFARTRKLTP
jgi:hypothetical protein